MASSPLPRRSDVVPDPMPHMVTRTMSEGWNYASQERLPAGKWQEQVGWTVEADGVSAWSMNPDAAVQMWRRIKQVRS